MDSYAQTIQKPKLKAEYKKTAESLVMQLKSDKYNGCYFNRTEKELNRLCTKDGWFSCQVTFMNLKVASNVEFDYNKA